MEKLKTELPTGCLAREGRLGAPLAAGILYKIGSLLSPAAGAVFMSASTIIVAINAQLLGRRE